MTVMPIGAVYKPHRRHKAYSAPYANARENVDRAETPFLEQGECRSVAERQSRHVEDQKRQIDQEKRQEIHRLMRLGVKPCAQHSARGAQMAYTEQPR